MEDVLFKIADHLGSPHGKMGEVLYTLRSLYSDERFDRRCESLVLEDGVVRLSSRSVTSDEPPFIQTIRYKPDEETGPLISFEIRLGGRPA